MQELAQGLVNINVYQHIKTRRREQDMRNVETESITTKYRQLKTKIFSAYAQRGPTDESSQT